MRLMVLKIYGAAILLALAADLTAGDLVVDNCDNQTNLNMMGYVWNFFDDSAFGGGSSLPGAIKDSSGNYSIVSTPNIGHTGGGMVLHYSLGPKKITCGSDCEYNFAGMNTMLCRQGQYRDMTGALSVSFWLKTSEAILVDFMVITKEVDDVGDSGYFHRLVPSNPVANTWTHVKVNLAIGIDGISRPVLAQQKNPGIAFSMKNCQKLQWIVNSLNVGDQLKGEIILDDIIIQNFSWEPDLCRDCIGYPGQFPNCSSLLSNMDTAPYNKNNRGYYWYCYNDAAGRLPAVTSPSQFSSLTGGVDLTIDSLSPPFLVIGPNGYNGTNGADIKFTLGPVFKKNSTDVTTIQPFVGIGTFVWNDKASTDVYNAQADGVTGVYFDYMTGGDSMLNIRFEVYANTFLKDGVVHYINVPGTQGKWKSATVAFEDLKLPAWDGVNQAEKLDKTMLKKLQWTVQGNSKNSGELAIDNVYWLGPIMYPCGSTVTLKTNALKSLPDFMPTIKSGEMKISLRDMLTASIFLVNTKGAIVKKTMAAGGGMAHINVAGIAKGMYLLVLKANTSAGIEFNKTVPIMMF